MITEQPYKTIKEMEIYCINKALIKYSTKKEAAKMLGISERGLFNKMYNYKLK